MQGVIHAGTNLLRAKLGRWSSGKYVEDAFYEYQNATVLYKYQSFRLGTRA